MCYDRNLVGAVRVKVDGRHEAGLRRVRVDPTKRDEAVAVLKVKDLFLVERGARVRVAALLGQNDVREEELVVALKQYERESKG